MSCKMREIINYCFIYDELSNVVGLCHLWELLDHRTKGRKKPEGEKKIQHAEVCFSQRRVQRALLCWALYRGNLKNAFVQEKHCLQPWTSSERGNILFGVQKSSSFYSHPCSVSVKGTQKMEESVVIRSGYTEVTARKTSLDLHSKHVYATEVDGDF